MSGVPDEFGRVVAWAAEAERRDEADKTIRLFQLGMLTVAELAGQLALIAKAERFGD
jgi:hypothetical protein